MPKELMTGARVSVAQMGDRMYKVVAGSSRPERALKNEVFRLCDTMTSREVGAVLGRVYERLGSREQTAFMAEYMKDLYGSGSRRLFVPKHVANAVRVVVKPVGRQQVEVKGLRLALTDGSVEEVPLVDVSPVLGSVAGKSGSRRSLDKSLARAKAIARANVKTTRKYKAAASADTGSAPPSGPAPDGVVTLRSVANYCMNTASRYSEAKPVYDMLMELYSRNPTQEWLDIKDEIKAHVDKLPGSSYFTFIGTNVERQIQNNVEKVENGGEVVMDQKVSAAAKKDGRKKGGSSQKVVKAVYRYNHLKETDGYKRLDLLYRALVNNEWLNSETSVDMFVDLFAGVPKEFTIKWLGTQAELYTLIKKMFDKGMIAGTKGGNKWDIAGSHFVNRKSQHYINWNKQKECKKGMSFIDDCILLLNPSVPMTGELLIRLRIA